MNIRNVLRTYGLLRQLSDDETALLETLRGLSEGDREQLVESLAPAKTIAKKSRKPRGKSARAASLAGAIQGTVGSRPTAPICGVCGNVEDYVDHSEPSPGYHEFQPPLQVRSASGD